MKPLCLILAAFLAIFGLAGCFQMERVIKLKPDGSGTIEETMMIPKAALADFQKFAPGNKPPDVFDEDRLKQAAGKMGEGVTFVSAKKMSSDAGEGFSVVYAFTDINKLKIDQNPGDSMSGPGGTPQGGKKDPFVFHFTPGQPAVLRISMPPPQFKPAKPGDAGPDDATLRMMQQMLKDLKIVSAIEVGGAISESNAEYHDGSRVTFMDVDFNKVLADPAKFKAMIKANPQTIEEAKKLIHGIEGVKIETAPEVTIQFQ
ncbi:hypothetical protein CfE428DRAFT_6273 [Chthoniobacter flavus Ellin428]|uniref:Lipoprotein n=1 Tax=Chthoniobacter flavus Ellin428 TaxID=497964 RepID=B4DBI2_9BACT|nr:hypothetical protein [Chthoniobacter flavus]EDY16169.1 hypothetical protein CfE428DRAFT_6273 [Chthoniobacter flavus Ellin428]TCO87170.1 hypothetical protein EV701_1237 [Chthoniobacter flavus]